ncbi:MAG: TIGR03619 family F420-dependent LLM class oxidoreductase [Actinomycetia bacterium]|nr:TIGR03619 family F420-dependent LLM class oxidoreductase [Actinomycetes bacterium]
MHFGVYGFHRAALEPDRLALWARRAEDLGVESLWVGDHLAMPVGSREAQSPRLEALSTLLFLAGCTREIRLAAGVIVLPQRHPVVLAKQLTSLDHLSAGRLIVGIGVGHIPEELAACGVSMAERGRLADEVLEAMLHLWAPDEVQLDDSPYELSDVRQVPQPRQKPHPPLIVGGHSAAAHRRAARVGDGWFGWLLSPHETAEHVAGLRTAREAAGRSPDQPFEITVAVARVPDSRTVRAYREAGVDRIVIGPDPGEDMGAFLDSIAQLAPEHAASP